MRRLRRTSRLLYFVGRETCIDHPNVRDVLVAPLVARTMRSVSPYSCVALVESAMCHLYVFFRRSTRRSKIFSTCHNEVRVKLGQNTDTSRGFTSSWCVCSLRARVHALTVHHAFRECLPILFALPRACSASRIDSIVLKSTSRER